MSSFDAVGWDAPRVERLAQRTRALARTACSFSSRSPRARPSSPEHQAREARALQEAADREEAAKAARREEVRRRKQEEKDAYDDMIAEKRKAMKGGT